MLFIYAAQLALPPYDEVARDVLSSIESDRLMVLDAGQQGGLTDSLDGGEEINLSSPAKKPASIRHWLAAGCQVIRWDVGDEIEERHRKRGVMAMYQQNAAKVLFPPGVMHIPPGPVAFVGEIIVNAECFPPGEVEALTKSFQFVLAHELTHVFGFIREVWS